MLRDDEQLEQDNPHLDASQIALRTTGITLTL